MRAEMDPSHGARQRLDVPALPQGAEQLDQEQRVALRPLRQGGPCPPGVAAGPRLRRRSSSPPAAWRAAAIERPLSPPCPWREIPSCDLACE